MTEQPKHNEKGKHRFKSEFSMGELDFQRFDTLLKFIDAYSFRLRMGHYQYMKHLYSLLCILYNYWKPVLYDSNEVIEIDTIIDELEISLPIAEKVLEDETEPTVFINKISTKVLSLHKKIMNLKQDVGLGIVVKSEMSNRKMIKLGVHGVGRAIRKPAESEQSRSSE